MYKSFEKEPLVSKVVATLRNKETKSPEFRKSLFKLGTYLAYEVSKSLPTVEKKVESPLGFASYSDIQDGIVIASVLRAALPMAEGVFDEFPEAHIGFLSASRHKMIEKSTKDFQVIQDYIKMPDSKGKVVIVVDPMLATASTMVKVINELKIANPAKIIVLCAIASKFGIDKIESKFPNVNIYAGAVDPELNEKGYILPGLGDAGDRAFNTGHL